MLSIVLTAKTNIFSVSSAIKNCFWWTSNIIQEGQRNFAKTRSTFSVNICGTGLHVVKKCIDENHWWNTSCYHISLNQQCVPTQVKHSKKPTKNNHMQKMIRFRKRFAISGFSTLLQICRHKLPSQRGSCWPQMGPMLASWTSLLGNLHYNSVIYD